MNFKRSVETTKNGRKHITKKPIIEKKIYFIWIRAKGGLPISVGEYEKVKNYLKYNTAECADV